MGVGSQPQQPLRRNRYPYWRHLRHRARFHTAIMCG
jgi:hypothetical protein